MTGENIFSKFFFASLQKRISAAHCVKKIAHGVKSVRLGEWDIEEKKDCSPDDSAFCASQPVDNLVVDSIVYPDYRQISVSQHFDIALLRLAKRVIYNDFIKPICLPLDPSLWTKDYAGHTFDVAGLTFNLFETISFHHFYLFRVG